jgi:molybdate transport system substrate-binding protein
MSGIRAARHDGEVANRAAWTRRCAALTLLAMAPLAAGCSASNGDADAADRSGASVSGGAPLGGSLYVLVAASLLPVTEAIAASFERHHPAVEVQVSGAGSSTLREQVLAGAPADVFIPADPSHVHTIRNEVGIDGQPVVVAHNSLVLAVPAGNAAGVDSLADLSLPELLIGLCAPEVPCGAHARAGLSDLRIEPAPDTEEPNVRALATKLGAGELDAAVLYASDVIAEPDRITSLGWPRGQQPEVTYEAAVLADAPNDAAAGAFVAYLQTDTARAAFADFGFATP